MSGVTAAARRPPVLGGGLPWLGHALALRRDPVAFLLRGYARLGEVFSFRLAGETVTAMLGPRTRRSSGPPTTGSARAMSTSSWFRSSAVAWCST